MRKFITLFLILSIIFAALGIIALAQGVRTNIYTSTGTGSTNSYQTVHNYHPLGIVLCTLSAVLFTGSSVLLYSSGMPRRQSQ